MNDYRIMPEQPEEGAVFDEITSGDDGEQFAVFDVEDHLKDHHSERGEDLHILIPPDIADRVVGCELREYAALRTCPGAPMNVQACTAKAWHFVLEPETDKESEL